MRKRNTILALVAAGLLTVVAFTPALPEGLQWREAFIELAATWRKLAAETELDEALFRAICEMDLDEPYEVLPRALKLRSWA